MIYRLLRLNRDNPLHRNAYYLVVELFWASILGSAATFNAAFALRLQATNTDVAYLSSIPALLAMMVSIPAGRFLQQRARRTPWILWALFANRLSYVLLATLPLMRWIHLPIGSVVVWFLIVTTIPAHFFNVGWYGLIADAVDEHSRAGLVTARMMIGNATTALFSFLFGQMLSAITFPYNYTLMYLIGFSASMVSMLCLLRLRIPDSVPVVNQPGVRLSFARVQQTMREHPGLTRLIINMFLYSMGLWLVAPLYILRYVRQLNASDAWIGVMNTIAMSAGILATPVWQRVMARWGRAATLKTTIVMIGLFPIAVGLSPSLTLILYAVAFNNLVAPGVNLSAFITLLEVTPEENRPGYTAWYISLLNAGAFVAPLLGVAIANWVGIAPTLVVFGALSVIGATSFWWNPVVEKKENPSPAMGDGLA